ncbi:MAG: DUF2892 domain-containing protein [Anaerolineales bacterium]
MKLNKNMGTADRLIRVVLGILFGYLYFSGIVAGVLGIILLVLGIILVLTSLVSFCPLYAIFNLRTNKKEA